MSGTEGQTVRGRLVADIHPARVIAKNASGPTSASKNLYIGLEVGWELSATGYLAAMVGVQAPCNRLNQVNRQVPPSEFPLHPGIS